MGVPDKRQPRVLQARLQARLQVMIKLLLLRSSALLSRSVHRRAVPLGHQMRWLQTETEQEALKEADSGELEQARVIEELKTTDQVTGYKQAKDRWNYDLELGTLAKRLGYDLLDLPSLSTALTHPSVIDKKLAKSGNSTLQNNDRLVQLGKAAVYHYVIEFLYRTYPNMNGSTLTDIANHLTNEAQLGQLAQHLGLHELLLRHYSPTTPSNVVMATFSDAFSAVLGAVHQDIGPLGARKVVYTLVIPQLNSIDLIDAIKFQHPSFLLSTILKSKGKPLPKTHLLRESGRLTHFPSFVVGVFSGEEQLAEGCGTSLRRAKREALCAALREHFLKEVELTSLPCDHEDYMPESAIELAQQLNNDNTSLQQYTVQH